MPKLPREIYGKELNIGGAILDCYRIIVDGLGVDIGPKSSDKREDFIELMMCLTTLATEENWIEELIEPLRPMYEFLEKE